MAEVELPRTALLRVLEGFNSSQAALHSAIQIVLFRGLEGTTTSQTGFLGATLISR